MSCGRWAFLICFLHVSSLTAQTPLPNPDLIQSCPYDIIFVLDESGSIVGQQTGTTYISPQIRSGSSSLISSLNGTGSRVAVVEFNSTARRAVIGGSIAYQTIDNNYVAAFGNYANQDNNTTPDASQFDPEDCSGCWTNWEDALNIVANINATEDTADLVIFFTDGMPTAYFDSSGTLITGLSAAITTQALLDAIGAANIVKTHGSHIFVVGIPNPNLPEPNVQAISDPDKYPVPEPNFLKGDYSVSTPATLQQDLANLVLDLIPNTTTAGFEYEITWSNSCDTFMVEFTNTSTGAVSYYWDFGDNVYSNDTSLIHVFSSGGPFVVMLAAHYEGICGRNDTLYDTLSFALQYDTLFSDFSYSYTPGCDSLQVQFAGTSSGSATFFWDFGNGMSGTGSSATAIYTTPGTYDVTLITTSTEGCTVPDTVMQPFTFTPLSYTSEANFDYQVLYHNDCDTFVVQFSNQSTGGTSYFWDFGNGISSADTNATVTFTSGTFDVMLQVNDSRKCSVSDTIVKPLVFTPVIRNPAADFTYVLSTSCDAAELSFTNLSAGAGGFIWRVNNSVISHDALPNSTFIYYKADTLNVQLIAEGINNCASDDTASAAVIIPAPYGYAAADFDFTPENPKTDETIQFINLSRGADTTLYQWDFGDGNYSREVHPQHAYSEKGEYQICLTADNGYDCPSTACKDIPVIYIPIVDLPTAFSPNGDDNNDVFIVRGKDIVKIDLKIFNRWGELVFHSNDPYLGWDGTYKGKPQEMEVYDWLLNATLKNGQEIFRKGNVTLLR
ncbi:MAG TPA: PKD domain-containing protein [Chitinophagales bacterium]|nr:PKD domain-containing protein [Chitinophagales bacterium]